MKYRIRVLLKRLALCAIIFFVAHLLFFYDDPKPEYKNAFVRETKGFIWSAKSYVVLETENSPNILHFGNIIEQRVVNRPHDMLPLNLTSVAIKTPTRKTSVKAPAKFHPHAIKSSKTKHTNMINNIKNTLVPKEVFDDVDHHGNATHKKADSCAKYNSDILIQHQVLVNYFNASNDHNHSLSLITQLTYSRLMRLKRLTEYWNGPISATVYMNKTYFEKSVEEIKDWFKNSSRSNIRIHYVFLVGDEYLPINKLRNIAQDNSLADHVFLIDIDFVPSKYLELHIQTYIGHGFFNSTKQNRALVVPATELLRGRFPESKKALLMIEKKKRLRLFHSKEFPPAHEPTNFARWKTATVAYRIQYKMRFEPYVVIKRSVSPKYDERFLQRFFNKVVHIYELKSYWFSFWVMPDGYLVHLPHKKSRSTSNNHRCAKKMYIQLRRDVAKKVKLLKKHKSLSSNVAASTTVRSLT